MLAPWQKYSARKPTSYMPINPLALIWGVCNWQFCVYVCMEAFVNTSAYDPTVATSPHLDRLQKRSQGRYDTPAQLIPQLNDILTVLP